MIINGKYGNKLNQALRRMILVNFSSWQKFIVMASLREGAPLADLP